MTVVAETIKENNIDDVISQLESCNYHNLEKFIDVLLGSNNIITSFGDLLKIIKCPIGVINKYEIVKKHIRYCDNVDNIFTLMNHFYWSSIGVEFIKLCKNRIKKISDLQKILSNVRKSHKFDIIKIFDFIGITYSDILKLVNIFDNEYQKKLVIVHFNDYINLDDTIRLVNESGVESIYEIFHVDNFDEFINIIIKLDNYGHKKQLAEQCEKLFNNQNIFKYLELLTDFSSQFEFIKSIYKKIVIENPLELLKCVNGITKQDDENRKQLLKFIVKKMKIKPDTKCLNYFVTEEGRIKMIDYLVKSDAIKLDSVVIVSEDTSTSSEDTSTSSEESTSSDTSTSSEESTSSDTSTSSEDSTSSDISISSDTSSDD